MDYDLDKVLLRPLHSGGYEDGTWYSVHYDYGRTEGHEYICNMKFFDSWSRPFRLVAVGKATNYNIHNKDYKLVKWLKKQYVPNNGVK